MGSKLPVNRSLLLVSLRSPSFSFVDQDSLARNATLETLSVENTQLDLSHVEPTTVLGCRMKFQLIQDALGFGWRKHVIKTSRCMGIELILNNHDLLGLWKMDIHQIAHTVSPVNFGASLGDFDSAPVLKRSKEHESVGCSFAAILVITLLCAKASVRYRPILAEPFRERCYQYKPKRPSVLLVHHPICDCIATADDMVSKTPRSLQIQTASELAQW